MGWGAETLNWRGAFDLGLPLCGQVLQPLGYLHKRCQKSSLKELAKLGSVPRRKCSWSGESLRLWILRLHKTFLTRMSEMPLGWGLYLPLATPLWWIRQFTTRLLLSLLPWFSLKKTQKTGTISPALCILHVLFSLYLRKVVLGSPEITEVSPWLEVFIPQCMGFITEPLSCLLPSHLFPAFPLVHLSPVTCSELIAPLQQHTSE